MKNRNGKRKRREINSKLFPKKKVSPKFVSRRPCKIPSPGINIPQLLIRLSWQISRNDRPRAVVSVPARRGAKPLCVFCLQYYNDNKKNKVKMDLHNINTTYPCRCKKGGASSEEKRMICKGLWAVFLATCAPPSGKCVVYLFSVTLDQFFFLCCRNTFVRRIKGRIKECA